MQSRTTPTAKPSRHLSRTFALSEESCTHAMVFRGNEPEWVPLATGLDLEDKGLADLMYMEADVDNDGFLKITAYAVEVPADA